MSTDKFIITKEDTNYSIIPNVICQTLADADALGLYVYLLSLPPQWEFYKAVIRKHFSWGRDKLEKKLTVLRAHNLIEPVPERNDKGQFIGWNLHVKNGRDFSTVQNTENQYSGDLSTGLHKNSTQNTEKPAAVKPVTGFDTAINNIYTNTKGFKNKSSCEKVQKKSKSDWRKENAKPHAFAESKNQMSNEAKHIAEHEEIKRSRMPDSLRSLVKNMKVSCGGDNHDSTTDGGRLQKDVIQASDQIRRST